MVRLVDALGLRTVSMCNQLVPRFSPVIDVLTWFDINHSFYAVFRLLCPLDFRTYVAPARRGAFVYHLLMITSCRSFVLQQEVSFSLLIFRGTAQLSLWRFSMVRQAYALLRLVPEIHALWFE